MCVCGVHFRHRSVFLAERNNGRRGEGKGGGREGAVNRDDALGFVNDDGVLVRPIKVVLDAVGVES